MALVTIGLAFGDSGAFELPVKAEYTRRYIGRSNNPFDNPLSISRDRLCPKPGQRDPFDPRAWITSVQAERRDATDLIWDITANSTTEFDPDEEENPLAQRARITLKADQYTRTTTQNAQGRSITTTAGSLIPVEIDDTRWVLSVQKNVRVIPAALLNLNNKTNSGSVAIRGLLIPRRKLQVKGLTGSEESVRVRNQRIDYVALSFELHYQREGYRVRLPNVDYVQLRETTRARRDRRGRPVLDQGRPVFETVTERVPILFGEPPERPSEPWPLDRHGKALPENYRASDVLYRDEDVLEETSFNLLPLT